MEQRRRDGLLAALVVSASLAALAARLWLEPVDHGYVRYAGLADEIVRTGDWIVLRLPDGIYLHKPPLFVWILALAMKLAGSAAGWTQHAPNLLALALGVGLCVRLGRRLFGRSDAAWLATLFLLTSVELLTLLRDKRIDPFFGALLLGAMDAFHVAFTTPPGPACRRQRRCAWLAAGSWLALATLTKGPLALVFFAAPVLTIAAWERRLGELARRELLPGALVYFALVSIWPLLLVRALGLEQTLHVLRNTELLTRVGGLLHYVLNLPIQLAPWTIFVPALVLHARRLARGPDGAAQRFLLAWIGSVFVLLHLSAARHSRYLLPLFPPLCLWLTTLWFDPATRGLAQLAPSTARWRDGATRAALLGLGHREDPPRAAMRLALVALFAIALLDAGRAVGFARRSTLPAARAALAPVAAGAPALLYALSEGPAVVVPMLVGRTLPRATSTDAVVEWAARAAREQPGWVLAPAGTAEGLAKDPRLRAGSRRPFLLKGDPMVLLELRPGS